MSDIAYLQTMQYLTCTVFLSSYRNTSESLGEREMLWEHEYCDTEKKMNLFTSIIKM